jgi:hypothetical protein
MAKSQLATNWLCQFPVYYESIMLYSTDPMGHLPGHHTGQFLLPGFGTTGPVRLKLQPM